MPAQPATRRSTDGRFQLTRQEPFRWTIRPRDAMRVPGVVFASETLITAILSDRSLSQLANVAGLPGIVQASFGMPDIHLGYGFPIGAVAATDVGAGGVVSPGGVGFDISCGVRLLVSELEEAEVRPGLDRLMSALEGSVPKGTGEGGVWRLRSERELQGLLVEGARFAVAEGHGEERDLERCEDQGRLPDADPGQVSAHARQRGLSQVGSLGSGNHFLEVQAVDRIVDPELARGFGLRQGLVCVMIHCGSRGLGHQVCTDHVRTMERVMPRYGIDVPDRQLSCAPVDSPEGRAYLGAMAAATNYGRANRQLLTETVRRSFDQVLGTRSLRLLYDVSHNLAKLERHRMDGRERLVCVQRKGATLALPPGDERLPPDLRRFGQPVLIPGSMGTASYVLAGLPGSGAFHSTCHGAGRRMSRHAALKEIQGKDLRTQLMREGIAVRAGSLKGLAEEAPFAYKDVEDVVRTCEGAGLARRVARLRPLGVLKG